MQLIPEQLAPAHVKFAGKRSEGSKAKGHFYYFVGEGDGCRLMWPQIVLVIFLHLLMFAGLFAMLFFGRWYLFMFANFTTTLCGLGVTGGVHRLWSHRSYQAKWPFRVLIMAMYTMTQQPDIWTWCEFHRVHHKYTDTDADPYNARRGMTFAHLGWSVVRRHPEYYEKLKGIDMSDLASDPIVMFQRKFYWPLHGLVGFVLPTLIPVIAWGEPPLSAVLAAAFTVGLDLHLTSLINSAAHLFGERPFKANTPGENPFTSIFCLGEGYHNYHHSFPRDYGAAETGSTFNLTKAMIDLMAGLGQTYDLKTTSAVVVGATRARMAIASSRAGHAHAHAHEEAPEEDYETASTSKSF